MEHKAARQAMADRGGPVRRLPEPGVSLGWVGSRKAASEAGVSRGKAVLHSQFRGISWCFASALSKCSLPRDDLNSVQLFS